jgi:hypothetical protein
MQQQQQQQQQLCLQASHCDTAVLLRNIWQLLQ